MLPPDCWYEYHNTLFGLAVTVNVALTSPGPVYMPLTPEGGGTLSRGTVVRAWIENPPTWPAVTHEFWYGGELWYRYTTAPTTRYHLTIRPDADGWVQFNVAGSPYCCEESFHIPCPADFNLDGQVNGDDADAFLIKFAEGCEQADFNDDGFPNGDDADAWALAFWEGC